MNFIEAVKKALFEESRKYSKAQEKNLNSLLYKISNDNKKVMFIQEDGLFRWKRYDGFGVAVYVSEPFQLEAICRADYETNGYKTIIIDIK